LYRIARNVVIDWYRKKSRKPEVAAGNGTTEDMETEGGFSAVDARIDVHKAMEELSDNHRNFLVMKFLRGMTNREIEKVLDKKSGAVRALQFRALGALREALFTEEND
jgi:RNA polymerase sigma-70 factor (ECF subfamily)